MPTQPQVDVIRKINRYTILQYRAYTQLAKTLYQEALDIQQAVTRAGHIAEHNTSLLDLILDQLDALEDLDDKCSVKRREVGAILCASAEDLLALRTAHQMPAYTRAENLTANNYWYRPASLWAQQERAKRFATKGRR
jgi:hypothetical protein